MVEYIGDINTARVLSKYPEHLSDLFGVSYIDGGIEQQGFGAHTEIFNDNITLKLDTSVSSGSRTALIVAARHAIREALGESVRVMRADNNQDSTSARFLITLDHTDIDAVLDTLKRGRPILRRAGLTVADIDFTFDCERITTRGHMEAWIDGRYTILDRRARVGDNCISWMVPDDDALFDRVRGKVYNKTVQMIESGGVRVVLGSSMHEYITQAESVQNTLLQYRDNGVSRLELTFYGDKLYEASVYKDIITRLYQELSTCTTFSNSLRNQWRALEPRLTQVLAVYVPESMTFAFCQWWNSLTGKMHGTSTKINKHDDLMKLLANYSFNSRPIHLITVTDRNEALSSYIRMGTSQPVTMLPGVKGGLYSARKDGMRSLIEYGIGTVSPGRLDWYPSMSYRTRAIADLEAYTHDEPAVRDLTAMLENLTVNNKNFKPVYEGLKPESTYIIVGVGRDTFRGKECVYVTMSTGERVRCGRYLEEIVKDREARGLFNGFSIRTGRVIKADGRQDIQCYIA